MTFGIENAGNFTILFALFVLLVVVVAVGSVRSLQRKGNTTGAWAVLIVVVLVGIYLIWKVQQ